jgi:hypothetical protein
MLELTFPVSLVPDPMLSQTSALIGDSLLKNLNTSIGKDSFRSFDDQFNPDRHDVFSGKFSSSDLNLFDLGKGLTGQVELYYEHKRDNSFSDLSINYTVGIIDSKLLNPGGDRSDGDSTTGTIVIRPKLGKDDGDILLDVSFNPGGDRSDGDSTTGTIVIRPKLGKDDGDILLDVSFNPGGDRSDGDSTTGTIVIRPKLGKNDGDVLVLGFNQHPDNVFNGIGK